MRKRIIDCLFLWGYNKRDISRLTGYSYSTVVYYGNDENPIKQARVLQNKKDRYNPIRNHLFDYLPSLPKSSKEEILKYKRRMLGIRYRFLKP